MAAELLSNNFAVVFDRLIKKSRVSCYKIAQYSQLDEGYLSRLRKGRKHGPSTESIIRIALALVHYSEEIGIDDVEELLQSRSLSILTKR